MTEDNDAAGAVEPTMRGAGMTKRVVSFGPVEDAAQQQIDRCLERGGDEARGVLCADHHKGYSMPIGGVLASQSVVMPAGVGYDIACGNCAVRTDLMAAEIGVASVMDEIFTTIAFGVGRVNAERVDHPVFTSIEDSHLPAVRGLIDLAANQLGTVGSGNHYVDLFEDRADGRLWVRRAFRIARLRPQDRDRVPRVGSGGRPGASAPMTAWTRLHDDPAHVIARSGLSSRDVACWPVRLRWPRLGRRSRPEDSRRAQRSEGPQPSQLRMVGGARWRAVARCTEGGDACVSRPTRFRRRLNG